MSTTLDATFATATPGTARSSVAPRSAALPRVLQINKFHYLKGGAERYYFDLSAAQRAVGCQIDHLAMRHARNEPLTGRSETVDEVDYHARHSAWSKLRVGSRFIFNREAAAKVRRLVGHGERPVAHLHNVYHQLSPSVIRALAREGVPIVQTLHDYKLICPAYAMRTASGVCERCRGGRYFEAVRQSCAMGSRGASVLAATEAYVHRFLRTYDRVARFLCPSRFMLEKVASFGIARSRLIHVPYFLPIEQYRVTATGDPSLCVYIGRLAPEKGIGTLVEAMARLPRGGLRLEVIGEGPLRGDLEALAARRCPERVRFLGFQSGAQLHDSIRRAGFAVVPSEWYENLPFAVLECFALGRPVVGARMGGIPELVADGETGRLHTSGDADSLAEALMWMTSRDADLAQMGARARRVIEEEHAVGPHLERLFDIYAEVLSETPPGRRHPLRSLRAGGNR